MQAVIENFQMVLVEADGFTQSNILSPATFALAVDIGKFAPSPLIPLSKIAGVLPAFHFRLTPHQMHSFMMILTHIVYYVPPSALVPVPNRPAKQSSSLKGKLGREVISLFLQLFLLIVGFADKTGLS